MSSMAAIQVKKVKSVGGRLDAPNSGIEVVAACDHIALYADHSVAALMGRRNDYPETMKSKQAKYCALIALIDILDESEEVTKEVLYAAYLVKNYI